MRVRLIVLTAALVGAFVSPASADGDPVYYLSLGDSLSTGYQPGMGNTDEGYPDQLHASLKERTPALELVKVGCGGETSTTLINGGRCSYEQGSQLKQAVKFLRDHPGRVKYVTIDIGGNDVNSCVKNGAPDANCVVTNVSALTHNLWTITSELRKAGGRTPKYSGMTYYNPLLAYWLSGPDGQKMARMSVTLINGVNSLEWTIYALSGFRVADVSKTFSTNDFKTQVELPGLGIVPLNVARICQWTYMCARKDIHANKEGYARIAETFARTLK